MHMKVLHVIPSLSPKHGGPSVALPLMARSLVAQGIEVDVATTDDDGPGCRLKVALGQRTERDGYGMFYFRKQTEFYKVSLPFRRWLAARVKDYDMVHIHAVFSHTSTIAARTAHRHGVPYIIRPLGVLNRWGMENRRRFIKSLSFRFVEKPLLNHAAAMHYTSRAEQREAEQAGVTSPAAVIPLGIDAAAFQTLPSPDLFLNQFPLAQGRPLVLFLSRLDAKKGLDLLLQAWAKIQNSKFKIQNSGQWLLVIAGNGEEIFVAGLKKRAAQLGLAEDILWTGYMGGVDKLSAFAAASVFVLPSYSENFGIALVEAMAAGLPCLTTHGVAVAEDILAIAPDALAVVPAEETELTTALEQLLADASRRTQLGAKAKRIVTEQFSLSAMGANLKRLYEDTHSMRVNSKTQK